MGLTRPTSAQIDSSTEVITDPISLLNNKSTQANVDVGFLFNRDGGISSNVAVFWQESNQRFVFALTTSNGVSRFSNIAVTSNANVVTGNVFAAGYFYSNGVAFTGGAGGSYSNVQVATYLPTYSGNIANVRLGVAGVLTFADGTTQITAGGGSYSNVQVATFLPTYSGVLGSSNLQVTGGGTFSGTLTIGASGFINSGGNVLSTGLSVFGNTRIGSLATPGALHTIIGNVDVSGAGTEYFNIGGNIMAIQGSFGSINSTGSINTIGNIIVNNTAISTSNVTGAIRTTGGIGVGGNLYVGQRVGYVWGVNNVSSVYQVFNNSTNSLDTVFG